MPRRALLDPGTTVAHLCIAVTPEELTKIKVPKRQRMVPSAMLRRLRLAARYLATAMLRLMPGD